MEGQRPRFPACPQGWIRFINITEEKMGLSLGEEIVLEQTKQRYRNPWEVGGEGLPQRAALPNCSPAPRRLCCLVFSRGSSLPALFLGRLRVGWCFPSILQPTTQPSSCHEPPCLAPWLQRAQLFSKQSIHFTASPSGGKQSTCRTRKQGKKGTSW